MQRQLVPWEDDREDRDYGDDTSETALFCQNPDNFFDALNVRNTSKGDKNVKIFLNLIGILMIQGLIVLKMYF